MNRHDLELGLEEFLIELRHAEKSPRTITKYETCIRRFIASLQEGKDITKDDVIAFKKQISTGQFMPSTINGYIVAVNKYVRWVGIDNMHVKKLKMQEEASLESVPSISDYKRLLRIGKRLGYEDIALVIKIITMTGIRIGELDFFTVESIQSNYIRVTNKGKYRDIIVTPELVREIRKYCKDKRIKEGRIFTMSKMTIWRKMQRIAGVARVNQSHIHAHAFRHLFAKNFMEEFRDSLELADLLGHEDLKTTRRYSKSTKLEKRKDLERLQKKTTGSKERR